MSIAEFDDWTLTANEQFTYELHDGILYGFATGTEEHSLISVRLTSWLLPVVTAPCRVHQGGVSVRRHLDRPSSVVPDVLVTCEPRERGRIYVTSPNFVAEVISPSSVTNDMYRKPIVYDAVESIMEYLVIDSRSMWVRLFRRTNERRLLPDGDDLISADQCVSLTTVDLQFTLADLYRDIL